MSITLTQLEAVLTHALGGADPSAVFSTAAATRTRWVNEAGRALCQSWEWPWLNRGPARLDFYAQDITGATFTHASKTLTKTGAFATYTFHQGDYIESADGTGVTDTDRNYVTSKTSDDAIVVTRTIGSGADGQTDISFSHRQPSVNLPSDFGQLRPDGIQAAGSLGRVFNLTTIGEINDRRMANISDTAGGYMGAIVHPGQTATTSGPPVARIEIYPTPTDSLTDALSVFYKACWTELSTAANVANVPVDMEMVLASFVRAVAKGYEEDALEERLAAAQTSTLYEMARRNYGSEQPSVGTIRNGHMSVSAGASFAPYEQTNTVPDL